MQAGVNGSADEAPDSHWMSYTELASARRIAMSSAIKLVKRRGWRCQKDNHGTMRALVPPEWSEPAPGKDYNPDASVNQAISALEASVAVLRERAEAAEQAARIAHERADRAVQARDAERQRANTLRDRIDALRAELGAATMEVEEARRQVEEAAEYAEAFRQADARWQELGRFGRIRQAWGAGLARKK
jgi:uncharacterized membrane protein YqiK